MHLKDLYIGDKVLIRKAGEVIPEVVQVVGHKRSIQATKVVMIQQCPACQQPLVKMDAMHYCQNPDCPARHVESVIHFASKSAMDIKGLGEKIIQDLFELSYIQSSADLYHLKERRQDLLQVDGYSDKSVNLILEAIESSKQRSLEKLIVGLGIKEIGEKTAKQLAKRFLNLIALSQASYQDLILIQSTIKI